MVNNSSSCMMLDEAFYGDHVIKVEGDVNNKMKRPNSLDLADCIMTNPAKMPKLLQSWQLTSPDLVKLNLNTPEIERFISNQQIALGHTSILTPSLISEDEKFTQPFFEELEKIRYKDSTNSSLVERPLTSSGSNSSEYLSEPQYSELIPPNDFTNMIPQHIIKEEQTVPSVTSSPPMSPINMESQEKIKLERKRQRNRVAASKCRRRKLERIAKLEDKVKELKSENNDLSTVLNRLLDQIYTLKQTVMTHVNNGCVFAKNCL